MPVRAVVFDVGNVLFQWDPRYLYEKLIADPDQLDWFLSNVVTHHWHFEHDAGRPLGEMLPELIARYPEHEALIAAYVPRWLESIPGPIPGSHEIVEELAARNIPLFAITNFGVELWDMFRPMVPMFNHFRDIVVSGVEKMVKPGPEIYQLALRRFELEHDEAMFVDDRLENVVAAEREGFVGHHFTDAPALRKALAALGLI